MSDDLTHKASAYLTGLCSHPDRHVGGPGNVEATRRFAEHAAACGFDVEVTEFDCVDWERGEATLSAGSETYEAFVGPYSLTFDDTAVLTHASTIDELEGGGFEGTLLLLDGELTREQVMPKNFVFFNPDNHRRIVAALENAKPAAIIAATAKNPGLTASLYPFPLIEDADFDIPSVYMTDVEGRRLLAHVGTQATLSFESERVAARAEHVVARRPGEGTRRVVVFGHIDSRDGTPGALDNATAVVAIMLLAEMLSEYDGPLGIELVPLNGEDYYAAPGQMIWVRENEGHYDEIVLGMNLDGAGLKGAGTAVSLYECPPEIDELAHAAMGAHPGVGPGEPWFQSDHSIFIQKGRPALAITTQHFPWLASEIAHTEKDVPDLVDPALVAEAAAYMRDVIVGLTG